MKNKILIIWLLILLIFGFDIVNASNNDLLNQFRDNKEHFNIVGTWWEWIFYTLVAIAKSMKNLFFWLATVFYLVIAIKLIVAEKTEDEVSKFKKWIIWITVWLIIMQLAYSFVLTLYAKSLWQATAVDLINNIINPLIWFIETLASFFFLAIAIFSFYRLVTAHGKEDEIKRAKMSIVYAIMWFVLIILAKTIVEWVYGKLDCKSRKIAWFDIVKTDCIWDAQLSDLTSSVITVINWANSFIWVITVLLIIYAWFTVIMSRWEEEKIKKAKSTIIYIAIWLFLLVINYLILTFFILPETKI